MNRRHRSAQLAGRASVQLHTLIFFAGDNAKEEDAYILDVETAEQSKPSFSVIVPRYGIEGRVSLPIEVDDPNLVRLPKEHKLTYKKGGNELALQVFDKVRVKITVNDVQDHQRELIIEMADSNLDSSSGKRKNDGSTSGGSTAKKTKRN